MSGYDQDLYSEPEKYGLTVVDSIDDPNASWDFDLLVVWQHDDGRVFYASDAGCSCPSPFEDFRSIDDLTEITNDSWPEFQRAVERHCIEFDYEFTPLSPGDDWVYDGDTGSATIQRKRWKRARPDRGAPAKTELLAKVSKLVPR